MASGVGELRPLGVAGDCADDGVVLPPLWAPAEQPVTADKPDKPLTTTSAPHSRSRRPHRRTLSIYATLAAVIERFGFCECCRP